MEFITVILPTLNPDRALLQKALDSIPLNINALVIINEYKSNFDRLEYIYPKIDNISFIQNHRDLGITKSVNRTVEYFDTDWVCFFTDDDYFLPNIENVIETVKMTKADIVYYPIKHCYEDSNPEQALFDNDPDITLEKNLERNQICGSAFVRKTAFQYLEGYFNNTICHDWDFYCRALKSGMKFHYVPLAGMVFRYRSGSKQQQNANLIGYDTIKKYVHYNVNQWNKRSLC